MWPGANRNISHQMDDELDAFYGNT